MTDQINWNFETKQIHSGQQPDPSTGSRALPIHQTTAFVFESTEQAANRFAPVSYTHLDVYKRQVSPRAGRRARRGRGSRTP